MSSQSADEESETQTPHMLCFIWLWDCSEPQFPLLSNDNEFSCSLLTLIVYILVKKKKKWSSGEFYVIVCVCVCVCICVCVHVQLWLTLCDPIDCSPPGSTIHGIFQPELEWVAISYFRCDHSQWQICCVSFQTFNYNTKWNFTCLEWRCFGTDSPLFLSCCGMALVFHWYNLNNWKK